MITIQVKGIYVDIDHNGTRHPNKVMVYVGSMATAILRRDGSVTRYHPSVFIEAYDIGPLGPLSFPNTRPDWERELRLALGSSDAYRALFPEGEGITDVYPIRLNPTYAIRKIGWSNWTESLSAL